MLGIYCPPEKERYSETVRSELPGEEVRVFTSQEDLAAGGRPIEALLLDPHMPALPLAGLATLKLVQPTSAGVEGLRMGEIPPRVRIARVVDLFGPGVGESVFSHLLARNQNIVALAQAQRDRAWRRVKIKTTLEGQRLGVAGLGSIGSHVVRLGRAFGMRMRGYSRTGAAAASLPLESHMTAAPGGLAEFANGLDVLVLTLPVTPATRRIVGRSVLAALGPRGVLVNVGRGGWSTSLPSSRLWAQGNSGARSWMCLRSSPCRPSALSGVSKCNHHPPCRGRRPACGDRTPLR